MDAAMQNGRGLAGFADREKDHRGSSLVRLPTHVSAPSSSACEESDKPLICHFFQKRAPLRWGCARESDAGKAYNNGNGICSQDDAAASSATDRCSAGRNADVARPATPVPPPYPAAMEEALDLLPLTPSVAVPLRASKRSGRTLNESETLQEKHGQEYKFLVSRLAYAIDCTVAAHEQIHCRHCIPLHVASPSSLLPSIASLDTANAEQHHSNGVHSQATSSEVAERDLGKATVSTFQARFSTFTTREVPTISIHDYLKRMVKYTYVSPSVLLCACLYLDRLLCMYPTMLIHSHNVFKLLLTSTRLSSKVMDTRTLNNHDFAVVGGVANTDLNALEFTMVELLQNRLFCSRETFDQYCGPLRLQAAHLSDGTVVEATGAEALRGSGRSAIPLQPIPPSSMRSMDSEGRHRSRRTSSTSQPEFNASNTSQSCVSPLRSASRPAFPPSTSTVFSISAGDVDAMGSSRALPSHCGSTSNSGRRHQMGASYSSLLPHAPHGALSGSLSSVAGGGSSATSWGQAGNGGVTVMKGGGGCDEEPLRIVANGTDLRMSASEVGGSQALASPTLTTEQVTVPEEKKSVRARSIPLSALREGVTGAATSREGNGRAISAVALSTAAPTAPNVVSLHGLRSGAPATASVNAGVPKNGAPVLSTPTTGAEDFGSRSVVLSCDDSSAGRHALLQPSREGLVALPPVTRCGRRGRPASLVSVAVASTSRIPPSSEHSWV